MELRKFSCNVSLATPMPREGSLQCYGIAQVIRRKQPTCRKGVSDSKQRTCFIHTDLTDGRGRVFTEPESHRGRARRPAEGWMRRWVSWKGRACLQETRGGRNVRHELAPQLRPPVYAPLAGYEITNDGEPPAQDPSAWTSPRNRRANAPSSRPLGSPQGRRADRHSFLLCSAPCGYVMFLDKRV